MRGIRSSIAAACVFSILLADAGRSNAADSLLALRGPDGRPLSVVTTAVEPEDLARAWFLADSPEARTLGARAWLPVASVDSIEVRGAKLLVRVTLGAEPQLDQALIQDALLALANTLDQGGILSTVVLARYGPTDRHVPIDDLIGFPPPVPPKPWEVDRPAPASKGAQPGWTPPDAPAGALSGKSVFVSQSHGWYYDSGTGEWLTQRGNTNDLVEDFINAEAVDQYLIQYLRNAGAGVYTCRERDMQTDEIIVDDGESGYSETGAWSNGSATSGFWGSGDRVAPAELSSGVAARWSFDPPAAGRYAVTAWARGGSTVARHALFTIHHSGGDTAVEIDQQRDGYTWRFLGFFEFDPSDPPERRSVTLAPGADEPGLVLVADAVRIGGGMGSIADGGSTSGRPRWEESGLYYAQFLGCSSCAAGTVSTMPRWAAWENEAWEDSIYFSWHTNAPDPGTGTSSFVYSSAGWDGDFNGVAGSEELQSFVHTEIINDIRAGYDPAWTDRGQHTANFGEINPSNNDEMPALLIELAFHDTASDAAYLKDPKFRMLAARAISQGIVRFFAWKDAAAVTLPPEPPTGLTAVPGIDGTIEIGWRAPSFDTGDGLLGDPATGYRIYTSTTPLGGFTLAATTTSTRAVLTGVAPGGTVFLRVSAVNDGGESFPTPVAAVRPPLPGQSRILIVDGFDRLDASALMSQYESSRLGWVDRMFLDRMNDFSYVADHAAAMTGVDAGVATAANEAVEAGDIDLALFGAVDWLLGEESTVDETFSDTEQLQAGAYLDHGGSLLVTGAELAWDLDWRGSAADQAFLADRLHAAYVQDDSGSHTVSGRTGGALEGLSAVAFDDGSQGIYEVDYPDALSPASGGTVAADYDGVSLGACTEFSSGNRTLVCGFPLETIVDPTDRAAFTEAAMTFLLEGRSCRGGDTDLSGTVDGTDTTAVIDVVFNDSSAACPDVSCDGLTDAADLAAVILEAAAPGDGPCP